MSTRRRLFIIPSGSQRTRAKRQDPDRRAEVLYRGEHLGCSNRSCLLPPPRGVKGQPLTKKAHHAILVTLPGTLPKDHSVVDNVKRVTLRDISELTGFSIKCFTCTEQERRGSPSYTGEDLRCSAQAWLSTKSVSQGPALACEMRWILEAPSRPRIDRAISSFDRPLSRPNKEASGR